MPFLVAVPQCLNSHYASSASGMLEYDLPQQTITFYSDVNSVRLSR